MRMRIKTSYCIGKTKRFVIGSPKVTFLKVFNGVLNKIKLRSLMSHVVRIH